MSFQPGLMISDIAAPAITWVTSLMWRNSVSLYIVQWLSHVLLCDPMNCSLPVCVYIMYAIQYNICNICYTVYIQCIYFINNNSLIQRLLKFYIHLYFFFLENLDWLIPNYQWRQPLPSQSFLTERLHN